MATVWERGKSGLFAPEGFLLRLVKVMRQPVPFFFLWGRPGARELMNFCHQFAALLHAGITVLSGLEILEKQVQNPRFKHALRVVSRDVEHGMGLAVALQQQRKVFPPFFVGMVDAGETGGKLDETMKRLALHYEKKDELEKKIKAATAYPKFVFVLIVGVVAFLLSFVLPSFAGIFAGMGAEPPLPTRVLIAAGESIAAHWQLLLLSGAAGLLLLLALLKIERVAYYADYLRLRLPLFGLLHRKVMVARFCRTLSTLLGSGVGLLRALELAKNVVDNRVFAGSIDKMENSIIRGESVAATLVGSGIFPLLVTGMVNVGEQSGRLEEMLTRAADLYEGEVYYVADRLGALLEPALVIFLSLVVGGIVLSVFLPLFGIFDLYL